MPLCRYQGRPDCQALAGTTQNVAGGNQNDAVRWRRLGAWGNNARYRNCHRRVECLSHKLSSNFRRRFSPSMPLAAGFYGMGQFEG